MCCTSLNSSVFSVSCMITLSEITRNVINFRGHRSVSGLEVDWGVNFTLIVKCMIVYTLFHKKKKKKEKKVKCMIVYTLFHKKRRKLLRDAVS